MMCKFCDQVMSIIQTPNFIVYKWRGFGSSDQYRYFYNCYEFEHFVRPYSLEGVKPICENCGKEFKKWKDLMKHVKSVHFKEKFDCHLCSSTFSRHDNLMDHICLIHDKGIHMVKYECVQSALRFSSRNSTTRGTVKLYKSHAPFAQRLFAQRNICRSIFKKSIPSSIVITAGNISRSKKTLKNMLYSWVVKHAHFVTVSSVLKKSIYAI